MPSFNRIAHLKSITGLKGSKKERYYTKKLIDDVLMHTLGHNPNGCRHRNTRELSEWLARQEVLSVA